MIGMDFGTTNSGIAAYDGQRLELIPIDPANQNATVARTALYITNDRQVHIGRNAIDTYYEQNLNRPVKVERVRVGEITLTFAELPSFVRDVYIDKDIYSPGRLFLSFKMALSSLNYLGTVVGSHFYFLEDIIALYLYIAKGRAEEHLGREIKQIVLGRPVRFAFDPKDDQLARERLLKAAFRAGYEEVYLQYEPIAAAHHYESTIHDEQNVLIFDFGGGTLDISVVRVGNPRNREVLANGGLPIAGDIFDQKIVRAKLPKHFGEDTYYRAEGKRLPVPSAYYEAFSNWQDMLTLQKPDKLEEIERIEATAEHPRQIRALRYLISSSYGLKMYDKVEAVKRQLSSAASAAIRLDAKDFDVYEPITRTEFERIIRPEIETVDAYLDDLLSGAGLKNEDIDRVIRTGGSSEIPAFIQLLERRFGAEKVRSLDTFSSVTSGLGIIGHRIEQGEMDATAYRARDYALEDRLENTTQNGIPAVDFDLMKKFVALVESKPDSEVSSVLVGLTHDRQVVATPQPNRAFEAEISLDEHGLTGELMRATSVSPDDSMLLCTSDYRFFRKSARQLARLNDIGLGLAETEGFQIDIFGDEYVSGVTRWDTTQGAELGVIVTTSGYFRSLKAEPLIARLEQSVPYQPTRLKGDPVTILLMREGEELVAFSSAGRAVSISGAALTGQGEGRLLSVPAGEQILAVYAVSRRTKFLLAAEDCDVLVVSSEDVPLAGGFGTSGAKVFPKRRLQSVLLWDESHPVLVVTSQRTFPLDTDDLSADKPRRAFKPAKGETLVGLVQAS